MKAVKYPLSINYDLWKRVQKEALDREITAAQFIRDRIEIFFDRKDARARANELKVKRDQN